MLSGVREGQAEQVLKISRKFSLPYVKNSLAFVFKWPQLFLKQHCVNDLSHSVEHGVIAPAPASSVHELNQGCRSREQSPAW